MGEYLGLIILIGLLFGILNIFAPIIIILELKKLNRKVDDIEYQISNNNIKIDDNYKEIKNKSLLNKIINIFIEEEKE